MKATPAELAAVLRARADATRVLDELRVRVAELNDTMQRVQTDAAARKRRR